MSKMRKTGGYMTVEVSALIPIVLMVLWLFFSYLFLTCCSMLRRAVNRFLHRMRLFYLHGMVKMQPFSQAVPLADSTVGAFYWLFLWDFKEKGINHFLWHSREQELNGNAKVFGTLSTFFSGSCRRLTYNCLKLLKTIFCNLKNGSIISIDSI